MCLFVLDVYKRQVPQFTIPDDKILVIELVEKNGGRHQTIRTAAWLEENEKPFWLRYVLVPGYSEDVYKRQLS